MKVGIHQPQYLPWPGFFDKVSACDIFVHLDTVQYQKRGLQNRNQIKTVDGPIWLTVPVNARRETLIKDVGISDDSWKKTHLRALEVNYRKSPYFDDYFPALSEVISSEWTLLGELNMALINLQMQWLGITCRQVRASELVVKGAKQDLIIELCRACDATEYISGTGAEAYQEAGQFAEKGVKLSYRRYTAPSYRQNFPEKGFLPGMSTVDLLFNEGSNSMNVIQSGRRDS